MLLSIKLTREYFTKIWRKCVQFVSGMGTLLGGGQHKQGRLEPGSRGAIAPSEFGRYVNPIRIRKGVDYAHQITTSPPPIPRIFRPSYGPASRGRGGHSHWLLMKTEKDKEQQCRWNYVPTGWSILY